ncbi:trypsin-like [Mya arenaria]|uniref:trypsin-like n=1 Tax=Mya arenaria TaxID=6604 RepID=UPI0022E91A8D|nr:trypsin-like [Mya arenaria]
MVPNIVGGDNAEQDEYPFWVYFIEDGVYFCGGSILDNMTVLTAAHCFPFGLNDGYVHQVVAGDYNYDVYEGTEQVRDLRALAIHPKYDPSSYMSADIAILKLATPFDFNTYVGRPVNIPNKNTERRAQKKKNCWVVGAGLTGQNPNAYEPLLQELEAVPRSYSQCKDTAFDMYGLTWNFKFICSIHSGKSGCRGDSGGPLVCFLNDEPVQMGVVSWGGSNCADDGFGAYTRPRSYKKWIMKNIANL